MKIRKFLLLLFTNIISIFIEVHSMYNAVSFKEALINNEINYIFVTRGSDKSIAPLPIKRVFCIFASLDKFLGGDGLRSEKDNFWKPDMSTDRELSTLYKKAPVPEDNLPEALVSRIFPIENKQKWVIIIFSEHFFSSMCALDSISVNEIIKCCNILTTKHPNLLICINFLHKYNFLFHLYDRVYNLPERLYLFCPPLPSSFIPISANLIHTSKKEVETQLLSESNKYNHLRFSNYSLIIWQGCPISCYRKTIYHTEQDSLISLNYGFDFGTWENTSTIELSTASSEHKEFAKLFNKGADQIVANRICADMLELPPLPDTVKLLIIQANGIPNQCKWESLVNPVICCVVDTSSCGMFFTNFESLKKREQKRYKLIEEPFVILEKDLQCKIRIVIDK